MSNSENESMNVNTIGMGSIGRSVWQSTTSYKNLNISKPKGSETIHPSEYYYDEEPSYQLGVADDTDVENYADNSDDAGETTDADTPSPGHSDVQGENRNEGEDENQQEDEDGDKGSETEVDTEVDTDVETDVDTEVDTDVDMDVDEGEEDENSIWMNGEQLITNRYSVRMFRQEAEDPPWMNMEELLTNRYSVRMFRQDPEETPMGDTSGRSPEVPMFPPVEVEEDSVMGEEVGGVKKRKREPEELPSNTRVKMVASSEGVRVPRPGLVCGGQIAEASNGGVPGPQIVDGGDVAVSSGPGTLVPAVSPAISLTAAEEGRSEPGLGVVGERGLEAGENTRSEAGVGKHPGASSSKSPPTGRGNRGQKGRRVGIVGGRIEKASRGGAGGRHIDAIRGCVRLAGEWGARAVVGGVNLLAGALLGRVPVDWRVRDAGGRGYRSASQELLAEWLLMDMGA